MLKNVTLKAALLCMAVGPVFAQAACVEGNVSQRTLDRQYEGITALPVARYLDLWECQDRRLNKIVVHGYSYGGPGLATLIINGRPVGVTTPIGDDEGTYEFKTDPDYNHIGNMSSMEIRLSGSFYIKSIEAHFATPEDEVDYWDTYGVFLGETELLGTDLEKTVIEIDSELDGFERFVFIAREDDFYVKRVTLYYVDGTVKRYGGVTIKEGEAARVDNPGCKKVSKIVILGKSSECCGKSKLQVRAKYRIDDDRVVFPPLN